MGYDYSYLYEEEYETSLSPDDINKFIQFILDHGNMRGKYYRM